MTNTQKTIKGFAIALAIFIIIAIINGIIFGISCLTGFQHSSKNNINFQEVYQNIQSVDIETISSNLIIESGTEWKVEGYDVSNTFTSKLSGSTLKIKEQNRWFWNFTSGGEIKITVPNEEIINQLKISAGAGRIEISNISAQKLDLDQGAGLTIIESSRFQNTDIDGGAGEMRISNSTLQNLDFDAGVGRVEIKGNILGRSEIDCGVGEIAITLDNSQEDYSLFIEKGIGNIKINGRDYNTQDNYGSGLNRLKIEGGIGNISVDFTE